MVTRCVCHDVTFAELLRLARERGVGLAELKRLTGCCTGCGTCEPYVRLTLRTGRTIFPVLAPDLVARIMREPAPERAAPPEKPPAP